MKRGINTWGIQTFRKGVEDTGLVRPSSVGYAQRTTNYTKLRGTNRGGGKTKHD